MADKVTPGKALSPEQYSGGFVDFYKDYLGSSGIQSTVPVEEEEEDKTQTYIAPNILGESNDDTPTSVLSMNTLGKSNNNIGSNIEHLSAADIQSMDLGAKTWGDYRSAKGLTDKVNLKAEAGYQGLAATFAGTAGSFAFGALAGTGEKTPWGVENTGAGGFRVIGNYANSMKFDALKEMQSVRNSYESYESAAYAPDILNGDYNIGYGMRVNGQNLIRPVGKRQYIGTLPMGVTNQQLLNQEALESEKLPNYQGGFGTEDGFGITNEGGYNSAGRFVDQYGNIAQAGLERHLNALADKDFFGNVDKARDWLDATRAKSGFFGSGMSVTEAQKLREQINSDNPNKPTTTTTQTSVNNNTYNVPELDGVYTGPGSLSYDVPEIDGISINPPELDGVYTGPYMDDSAFIAAPSVRSSPTSPVSRTYYGNAGVDLAAGGPKGIELSRSRLGDINQGPNMFTVNKGAGTKSRTFGGGSVNETRIFNTLTEMMSPKEAADYLNRRTGRDATNYSLPSVTPASYTVSSSDDNNDSSPTQDQVQAEADMGLDPFGGAGEPVDNSGGGDSSSGDKIICTAMNNAYGFGSFRQTVWLKHSKNLDPAYQLGYHKLFRPLVKYAYVNDNLANRIIKKWLEGVAKRRTADIWLQSRNKKRPLFGRLERAILEPICYIAGKI